MKNLPKNVGASLTGLMAGCGVWGSGFMCMNPETASVEMVGAAAAAIGTGIMSMKNINKKRTEASFSFGVALSSVPAAILFGYKANPEVTKFIIGAFGDMIKDVTIATYICGVGAITATAKLCDIAKNRMIANKLQNTK